MKPIGPLMKEHRLIERMVNVITRELANIRKEAVVNPSFIDLTVDFFRIYADRTHHGKEEDILFKGLFEKSLSEEQKKIINELIAGHIFARETVSKLLDAKEDYVAGNNSALDTIIACMTELIKFYPRHIEKEDKHFFYPCMEYFTKQEQDAMLLEFWEFDKKGVDPLIH
jgi:hemerythrin-like domain-containing protein